MAPWSSAGDVLRWWRSAVLGLSQQQVAELLTVKPTALSNWENGARAISVDSGQLDDRLGGGGVLAGLLRAVSTPLGLEPQRCFSAVFPGESTPVWLWVRSPAPAVDLEAEWGVMRFETRMPLGPNGAFLAIGSSAATSALRIQLRQPGWCDVGRGELPASIPGATLIPAIDVLRRSSANGPFMQLFLRNMNDHLTNRDHQVRPLASLAMMAPGALASYLAGLEEPGDGAESEGPSPWPPAAAMVTRSDHHDRRQFARLRSARGLSLADTTNLLAEVAGIHVGKDTLRRFETDVGQPHHRLLPVALDQVLGAGGHLGRVVLRSACGSGSVRFPGFWTGPVWLGVAAPAGECRLDLSWGDWRRPLRLATARVVSFVCANPAAPLRISAPPEVRWTVGLGWQAAAPSIDQNWVPTSVAAAQAALRQAEEAFAQAIRAGEPVSTG